MRCLIENVIEVLKKINLTNVNSDYLFHLHSYGRTVDNVENAKEELDFFVGLFQMDLAFSETLS